MAAQCGHPPGEIQGTNGVILHEHPTVGRIFVCYNFHMTKGRFLTSFFLLSLSIGVLQVAAVKASLYYEMPWLDTVTHTGGGVWIACIVFAFYLYFTKGTLPLRRTLFLVTGVSILFVAISWEVFEVLYGIPTIRPGTYWTDTISDIFFGTFGAFLAAFILSKKYNLQ